MSKAEFQSWETNVSKVRQYSRDGEWTSGVRWGRSSEWLCAFFFGGRGCCYSMFFLFIVVLFGFAGFSVGFFLIALKLCIYFTQWFTVQIDLE